MPQGCQDHRRRRGKVLSLLHIFKTRELPEIDDEFVKDVSEFDTLDELRADVKQKLSDEAVREGDNMVEDQLVNQLIDVLQAEIPGAMYERRIDDNIRNFEARLRGQGMDVNTYLQYTGMQLSLIHILEVTVTTPPPRIPSGACLRRKGIFAIPIPLWGFASTVSTRRTPATIPPPSSPLLPILLSSPKH